MVREQSIESFYNKLRESSLASASSTPLNRIRLDMRVTQFPPLRKFINMQVLVCVL